MTTTTAITTVAIAPSATIGKLDVTADDVLLGSIKNGGHIVKNAERVIAGARLLRTGGYSVAANGALVATAAVLA